MGDHFYMAGFSGDSLVLVFWISFVSSAISAYPIWLILIRLRSRQTVSKCAREGHQAKQGTPTMGGLIIVIGALLSCGYLVPEMREGSFTNDDPGAIATPNLLLIALILLGGFALIGFIDDFL